jgi:death-on-curing family protein
VIRYLTFQEIVSLNTELILESGGFREGAGKLLTPNSLHYTVGIVQAKLNDELYPSLAEKAAKYAFQIIRGHPFVDGNKRTGTSCAFLFLRLNGCEFSASITNDEVVQFATDIERGALGLQGIAAWIQARVD